MLLRRMFSRKWFVATLLVIAGTFVLIRLGIWQLDRLDARQAANAHYVEMESMPRLDLNAEIPDSLDEMEYRAATVTGEYDFENQIAVRNQIYRDEQGEQYGDQYGYHLFTPLLFDPSTGSGQAPTAVLVDRGWIPLDGNTTPADWRKYDEPGEVKVEGVIRLGLGKPAFGGVEDSLPTSGTRLEIWNNADVPHVADQTPYPILNIYIQQAEDANDTTPPIPAAPGFELTEGSNFGYAVQWFTFAAILFFGYPFYIRKQESTSK